MESLGDDVDGVDGEVDVDGVDGEVDVDGVDAEVDVLGDAFLAGLLPGGSSKACPGWMTLVGVRAFKERSAATVTPYLDAIEAIASPARTTWVDRLADGAVIPDAGGVADTTTTSPGRIKLCDVIEFIRRKSASWIPKRFAMPTRLSPARTVYVVGAVELGVLYGGCPE